ncbi:MAG: hypothetical protein WBA31_01165 [Candidatus Dormiibacterota bacterium]
MSLHRPEPPAHRGHGHRTWLHLLPQSADFVPSPDQVLATGRLLIESGLAILGPDPETLLPGPAFAKLLSPGQLPLAGVTRGEVRVESGVLRCYPDPGPEGFDTEPPPSYAAACPACNSQLEFFRLRFPEPNPMQSACPTCQHELDVSRLSWSPRLPVARAEVTFGDLEGRPSLRKSGVTDQLAEVWRTTVIEVHVTL